MHSAAIALIPAGKFRQGTQRLAVQPGLECEFLRLLLIVAQSGCDGLIDHFFLRHRTRGKRALRLADVNLAFHKARQAR